jgi:hypothetical protein
VPVPGSACDRYIPLASIEAAELSAIDIEITTHLGAAGLGREVGGAVSRVNGLKAAPPWSRDCLNSASYSPNGTVEIITGNGCRHEPAPKGNGCVPTLISIVREASFVSPQASAPASFIA